MDSQRFTNMSLDISPSSLQPSDEGYKPKIETTYSYTASCTISAEIDLTNIKIQGSIGNKAVRITLYFDGEDFLPSLIQRY